MLRCNVPDWGRNNYLAMGKEQVQSERRNGIIGCGMTAKYKMGRTNCYRSSNYASTITQAHVKLQLKTQQQFTQLLNHIRSITKQTNYFNCNYLQFDSTKRNYNSRKGTTRQRQRANETTKGTLTREANKTFEHASESYMQKFKFTYGTRRR